MPKANYQYVVKYTSTIEYNIVREANACITAQADGALSVDGVTPAVGDLILLKDQTDKSFNGIYEVLVVGDGSTKFQLKRSYLSLFAKTGSTVYTKAGDDNIFLLYVYCLDTDPHTTDIDDIDIRLVTGNSALGPEVECRVTYWSEPTKISSDSGLLWDPVKHSFAAGEATGSQWDKTNRGEHSQGFGKNTESTGDFSLAGGNEVKASGQASLAFGFKASGTFDAQSDGSMAQGYVESGTITTGTGAEGSFAQGYTSGSGVIQTGTDAEGSFARGFSSGGTIETGSTGDGSEAAGYVGGSSNIRSLAIGSTAKGYAGSSGLIIAEAGSDGSFAQGYANNGTIETDAAAKGAFARGHAYGVSSLIKASGDGAFAEGYANASASITSSGRGAHAEGSTLEGSILASAEGSCAEGTDTEAAGEYSHSSGASSIARLRAQQALGSGHNFGSGTPDARGNAQCCKFVVRNATSDNTQTELFLDGDTGTQRIEIPDQSSWAICAYVVARGICSPGGGAMEHADAAYNMGGLIVRDDVNSTFLMLGLIVNTIYESTAATPFSVTATAENNAFTIKVTGDNNCDVRWVSCVETTEVMFDRVAEVAP